MAIISQKTQYALRAVFELARHQDRGPVKIAAIAEAQAIPKRFLENILLQLRGAGIVDSRRGKEGGYFLVREAAELSVGEVIRLMQGPLDVVDCVSGMRNKRCPLEHECLFLPVWTSAGRAQMDIFDGTTFEDLVKKNLPKTDSYVPTFSI